MNIFHSSSYKNELKASFLSAGAGGILRGGGSHTELNLEFYLKHIFRGFLINALTLLGPVMCPSPPRGEKGLYIGSRTQACVEIREVCPHLVVSQPHVYKARTPRTLRCEIVLTDFDGVDTTQLPDARALLNPEDFFKDALPQSIHIFILVSPALTISVMDDYFIKGF